MPEVRHWHYDQKQKILWIKFRPKEVSRKRFLLSPWKNYFGLLNWFFFKFTHSVVFLRMPRGVTLPERWIRWVEKDNFLSCYFWSWNNLTWNGKSLSKYLSFPLTVYGHQTDTSNSVVVVVLKLENAPKVRLIWMIFLHVIGGENSTLQKCRVSLG